MTDECDVLRAALYSILTVCGLEGDDPGDTEMAFQMIRDTADRALADDHD